MRIFTSAGSLPVLSCLIVVGAAATYLAVERPSASSDRNEATPAARGHDRSHEETAKQQHTSSADLMQPTLATDASAADVPYQKELEPAAPLSEAEMDYQREQAENRLFAQLDDHFAAQPVDSGWSKSMSTRITEEIGKLQVENSRVEGIDCRVSVCKISLSAANVADFQAVRDGLRLQLEDVLGSGAFRRNASGQFILYLATDLQALGMTASSQQ